MTVPRYIKEEVEVDVEFPIYAEMDTGETTIQMVYSKVIKEKDGTLTQLILRMYDENRMDLEIEKNYILKADQYSLGLGIYQSTEADFEEALKKIMSTSIILGEINHE